MTPPPTTPAAPSHEQPAASPEFGMSGDPAKPDDAATAATGPVTQPPSTNALPPEQPLDPPTPAATEQSNLFGTPRPPIVFTPSPAPAHSNEYDTPPEPSPAETPAALDSAHDDDPVTDVPADDDAGGVASNEPGLAATEPDTDAVMDAVHLPNDEGADEADAPLHDEPDNPPDGTEASPETRVAEDAAEEAAEKRAAEDEIAEDEAAGNDVAEDEVAADEQGQERVAGEETTEFEGAGNEYAEEDSADSPAADPNSAEHSTSAARSDEPPAPEGTPSDDDSVGTVAPDEPCRFEDSLEEAASRMGMDLRASQGRNTTDSHEDFIEQKRQSDTQGSDLSTDERAAEPADESDAGTAGESSGPVGQDGIKADDDSIRSPRKPAEDNVVARRESRPPATDDDDSELARAVREAGMQEPGPPPSGSSDEPDGELARAIREAEQNARHGPDPSPPRPEPKTEEEMAAAARELGISFRDDPVLQDNEMIRAASDLGISFRDDPAGPAPTDPVTQDDPDAKAARELGINFRDSYKPEAEQKSMFLRFWPIILALALAALAMPIVTAFLMLSGD
jgi:hypothetical protein